MTERFKIIILNKPVKTISHDFTQEIFGQLLALKVKGYSYFYDSDVLPMDQFDFIGNHLIITDKLRNNLPVCAYKSITLEECKKYDFEFPALTLAKKYAQKECLEKMKEILCQCEEKNISISYDGHWTACPEVRKEKKAMKEIMEMVNMIGVRYHNDFNISEWITNGVVKAGTDQFFTKFGCKPISSKPHFKNSLYDNLDSTFFHMQGSPSEETLDFSKKYGPIWEDKVVINSECCGNTSFKIAS